MVSYQNTNHGLGNLAHFVTKTRQNEKVTPSKSSHLSINCSCEFSHNRGEFPPHFSFSLDVQATAALDADLETQRQNMFIKAIKLLAKKLRVKREISAEKESNVS